MAKYTMEYWEYLLQQKIDVDDVEAIITTISQTKINEANIGQKNQITVYELLQKAFLTGKQELACAQ